MECQPPTWMNDALAHGESLLRVDVSERQVAETVHLIHQRHPEATIGGGSRGTPAFGL